jgi:hypothetical protein
MAESRAFRVDPELLTGASGGIDDAVTTLGNARDTLSTLNSRLQSSGTLSQDGDADDQVDSFVNRWSDEFEIIGNMLGGFKSALGNAAEVYTAADEGLAARVTGEEA